MVGSEAEGGVHQADQGGDENGGEEPPAADRQGNGPIFAAEGRRGSLGER